MNRPARSSLPAGTRPVYKFEYEGGSPPRLPVDEPVESYERRTYLASHVDDVSHSVLRFGTDRPTPLAGGWYNKPVSVEEVVPVMSSPYEPVVRMYDPEPRRNIDPALVRVVKPASCDEHRVSLVAAFLEFFGMAERNSTKGV